MSARSDIQFVAIVGGSGAGKTWLAHHLQKTLGRQAACLSLDSFYRDRSHLPAGRRNRINFDHPRAIDWPLVEQVLKQCRRQQFVRVPVYDFSTHARNCVRELWQPSAVIIMDGLWLLRPHRVRRFFNLKIYLDCPEKLRLKHRLARDAAQRGRNKSSVRKQFRETVVPMHHRYVTPQRRWADLIVQQPLYKRDVTRVAQNVRRLIAERGTNHETQFN